MKMKLGEIKCVDVCHVCYPDNDDLDGYGERITLTFATASITGDFIVVFEGQDLQYLKHLLQDMG